MNKLKQVLLPVGILSILISITITIVNLVALIVETELNKDVQFGAGVTRHLSEVCYTTNSEICD